MGYLERIGLGSREPRSETRQRLGWAHHWEQAKEGPCVRLKTMPEFVSAEVEVVRVEQGQNVEVGPELSPGLKREGEVRLVGLSRRPGRGPWFSLWESLW